MRNRILVGDCLNVLGSEPSLQERFARLVYIDPPFDTGRTQKRQRISATRSQSGSRAGFGGHRYETTTIPSPAYNDSFDDYLGWLMPRIDAVRRCMTDDASLFVHLDYRWVHYVKVELDRMFGRDSFINEIIWSYDYGGRPKNRWPCKHDTILWYACNPDAYVFNYDEIDRIPYMAPSLVGAEKAERGKTPTDVWWNTIVPTNGREKTGYPTQKPLGIVERIVRVHSEPGDVVLDCFAGSGTTGEAAAKHGRSFVLVDESPDAIAIMRQRLGRFIAA